MPIYKAISFQTVLSGGRTKPWLVLVDTGENGVQPYVMKLFDSYNLDARDHVTAEVIGYVLTKEFDFNVPEAAFIEINEDFLSTIQNEEHYWLLERKDARLKFGSSLVDNAYLFDTRSEYPNPIKLLDLQMLFAFDNLIRNRDRNNYKPNLLIRDTEIYLIDHEMGLELTSQTIIDFKNEFWDKRFADYHISVNYLKVWDKEIKTRYFETFEEYLKNLKLTVLETYFKQLGQLGFSTDRHILLREYFQEIKNNSAKFVRILKSTLDDKRF